MTIASVAALLGAMLAIAIVPGPSDLLVIGRSIGLGFTHGLLATLGIIAADYVFVICALLSLGWIAEQLGSLFRIVELVCGVYLVVLGAGAWRARPVTAAPTVPPGAGSAYASLASGFLLALGDPKAIFFYMGLLPAFVDPATATWREALIVMLAATVTIAGIKLFYAALAGRARVWIMQPRLSLVSGTVLAGTGAWLIWRAVA
ncbi:MAG TPA: LysE family translocator [Gammaproteobacteria bacterium]|nr:LysE family translocator [Gammaproteobacteria bacterium]